MFRFVILMVVVPLLLALAGCSSLQTSQRKPFDGLPFRHNGQDLKKAWKASPSPKGLAIQGSLKNIRYFRMEDVEISVSLVKKDGTIFSGETIFLPGFIDKDGYRDFDLVLKNATASPGDLLQFIIKYSGLDGTSTLRWTSDFSADAVTGIPVRKAEEMSSDD